MKTEKESECPVIWKSTVSAVKEAMAAALATIESATKTVPWTHQEVYLSRETGSPKITFSLFNDAYEDIAISHVTLDEFLDETYDTYYEEDWGNTLIKDLETLKKKIDLRIAKARKEMSEE